MVYPLHTAIYSPSSLNSPYSRTKLRLPRQFRHVAALLLLPPPIQRNQRKHALQAIVDAETSTLLSTQDVLPAYRIHYEDAGVIHSSCKRKAQSLCLSGHDMDD
jgi:hypothetical protein